MDIAAIEIIVGIVAITWLATLIWSLYVILTTPQRVWNAAQMSQTVWLSVVVFMPVIGTALFVLGGYRQVQQNLHVQSPEATSG